MNLFSLVFHTSSGTLEQCTNWKITKPNNFLESIKSKKLGFFFFFSRELLLLLYMLDKLNLTKMKIDILHFINEKHQHDSKC